MLHMIGKRTGKHVSLDAVRRCVAAGMDSAVELCSLDKLVADVTPVGAQSRVGPLAGHSEVSISWDIALQSRGAQPGQYRILYHGDVMQGKSKADGVIAGFSGTSNVFTVK